MADILFQNKDVCILHPLSSRGILVFSRSGTKKICTEGLYTYNKLRKVHPELRLPQRKNIDPTHNDLIFFRAPTHADTTTFETSFNGQSPKDIIKPDPPFETPAAIAVIRIDPKKTFVYSSETRIDGTYADLIASRISMTKYLKRIHDHEKLYSQPYCGNMITYEKKIYKDAENCRFPWKEYLPKQGIAEVVVKLPHIPPTWFVSCEDNGVAEVGKTRQTRRRSHRTRRHSRKN
jgi:hypothetical protein